MGMYNTAMVYRTGNSDRTFEPAKEISDELYIHWQESVNTLTTHVLKEIEAYEKKIERLVKEELTKILEKWKVDEEELKRKQEENQEIQETLIKILE